MEFTVYEVNSGSSVTGRALYSCRLLLDSGEPGSVNTATLYEALRQI